MARLHREAGWPDGDRQHHEAGQRRERHGAQDDALAPVAESRGESHHAQHEHRPGHVQRERERHVERGPEDPHDLLSEFRKGAGHVTDARLDIARPEARGGAGA